MKMIFRMVRPSKEDNGVKNNKEYILQYNLMIIRQMAQGDVFGKWETYPESKLNNLSIST